MPSRGTLRSYQNLLDEIGRARDLASDADCCAARAGSVSHWSVQQQLDHLLMTDNAILDGLGEVLQGSFDERRGGSPTMIGRFILWTGVIPRGRGRAPEFVLPTDRRGTEIEAGLDEAISAYRGIEESLADLERHNATRPHPLLGHFNAVQWLRFAHVHHRHHRKIIADILAAVG